jgi:hypothetical protein
MKTFSHLVHLLTRGFWLIPLFVAAACGTLEASVQVETTAHADLSSQQPDYVFADVIILRGYSLPSLDVTTGSELLLRLHWEVMIEPEAPYAIAIDLRQGGPEGRLIAQYSDNSTSWTVGHLVTEHKLYVPQDAAEGNYKLQVHLYHAETGALTYTEGPEGPAKGPVHLATLHLTKSALSSPLDTPFPVTQVPIATTISPTSTPSPDSEATYVPTLPPTPEQTFESDRFEAGPFSFDFRLYRNPGFGDDPSMPWMYSDLPGIGVHVSWVYHGPGLTDPVTEHWGVSPEIYSFFTHPSLQDGENSAHEGGIVLPAEAQAGDEVQYIFKLETSQGTYGGAVQFTLQQTSEGFQPSDVVFIPLR